MTDKRFQVFVSSTFDDLKAERQEVIHALLELDCIPSGMELFPAANEDQWTLIKKVIDDCDYYVVIVAGRYGSVDSEGMSYTEKEYRYALERGKPIIAFLHRDPGSIPDKLTEKLPANKTRLEDFRKLCREKTCKQWETPADLGSVVSRSLIQLMKAHPAIGWVRADSVAGPEATEEILRLRKRVDELENDLQSARTSPPKGTDTLCQGNDQVKIAYSFDAVNRQYNETSYSDSFRPSWNSLFAAIAPVLIQEATDGAIQKAMNAFIERSNEPRLTKIKEFKLHTLREFRVEQSDFQTMKVQLLALGLMKKSTRPRSLRDIAAYWTLTPYGETVMTQLRAIHRKPALVPALEFAAPPQPPAPPKNNEESADH